VSETVSARYANQNFARILRAVESGAEFVVTRNGTPVAQITSASGDASRRLTVAQEEILARTMRRLREGWSLGGKRVGRDGLHDR
jgi:prevent-host-death family protein